MNEAIRSEGLPSPINRVTRLSHPVAGPENA
jgi:hypothetical protein